MWRSSSPHFVKITSVKIIFFSKFLKIDIYHYFVTINFFHYSVEIDLFLILWRSGILNISFPCSIFYMLIQETLTLCPIEESLFTRVPLCFFLDSPAWLNPALVPGRLLAESDFSLPSILAAPLCKLLLPFTTADLDAFGGAILDSDIFSCSALSNAWIMYQR